MCALEIQKETPKLPSMAPVTISSSNKLPMCGKMRARQEDGYCLDYCKSHPRPSVSMVTSFAFPQSLPKSSVSCMFMSDLDDFCELPFMSLVYLFSVGLSF